MLAYSTMPFARPADCGINLIIIPAGDTFYSTTLSNNKHINVALRTPFASRANIYSVYSGSSCAR